MQRTKWIISLFLLIGITSCKANSSGLPTTTVAVPSEPVQEVTVIPSDTPEPMAARVNDYVLSLEEYQAELSRYELILAGSALGEKAVSPSEVVIQSMIEDVLLKQGAEESGYQQDPNILQQKLEEITNRIGGSSVLDSWMQKNGYDIDSLKKALEISIAASWMRDKIVNDVPSEAEQIHALQILVLSEPEALGILQQLRTGADFATIAEQYDPITKGDLGWFPRDYLLQPAVEEAAFSLQIGATSDVIATSSGYHIIQVVEREDNHPLSPEAYTALQRSALNNWIETRKENSQIEIFIQ
jgi:parvulin-like peptidyl-prolyl isomerase